jgi:hypothetical protein
MLILGFLVGVVITILGALWYGNRLEERKLKKQEQFIKRISEGFCFDDSDIGDYEKRYES